MEDFFKGVNLNDQKKFIPVMLYRDLLNELSNVAPVTSLIDIGAFLHVITILYMHLNILKDVCNADPKIVTTLKELIDDRLSKAIEKGFDEFKGKGI